MGPFVFYQHVSVLRSRCFQTGRRARPIGPRGDTRSALQVGPQAPAVVALRGPHQPLVAQSPVVPRSAPSATRVLSQGPVQSLQTPGQSSANKGAYRPLSPRVGPISQPVAPKSRQVIVSSPGSPSSSSDSQSGSDTIKHNIPSRVNSPNPRQSPSLTSLSRVSPNVGRSSPSIGRASPSLGRASPNLGRASPNIARSSSPAMQASNAGLAVTMNGPSTLSALQTTISNINTTANNIFMSTNYTQPIGMKFASTNPFLTGAYLTDAYDSYTPTTGSKYNTISTKNDIQKYGSYDYSSNMVDTAKYSTLGSKMPSYAVGSSGSSNDAQQQYQITTTSSSNNDIVTTKYVTLNPSNGKYNTIGTTNGSFKYDITMSDENKQYGVNNGGKLPVTKPFGSYQHQQVASLIVAQTGGNGTIQGTTGGNMSGMINAGGGGTGGALLSVEETPTPTSSIETEDSNTREVGEKDVEGDAEQSD